MRASATLTNGSCGGFGTYSNVGSAGVTSPYNDTSVASGTCDKYEYVVLRQRRQPGHHYLRRASSRWTQCQARRPRSPLPPVRRTAATAGTRARARPSRCRPPIPWSPGSPRRTTRSTVGLKRWYPGSAVTIPDGSAQTISYWSVDNAGNTEATNTTSALKIRHGRSDRVNHRTRRQRDGLGKCGHSYVELGRRAARASPLLSSSTPHTTPTRGRQFAPPRRRRTPSAGIRRP